MAWHVCLIFQISDFKVNWFYMIQLPSIAQAGSKLLTHPFQVHAPYSRNAALQHIQSLVVLSPMNSYQLHPILSLLKVIFYVPGLVLKHQTLKYRHHTQVFLENLFFQPCLPGYIVRGWKIGWFDCNAIVCDANKRKNMFITCEKCLRLIVQQNHLVTLQR